MTTAKLDDDIIKEGEQMIFNPYNSLNIEIKLQEVLNMLSRYGAPAKVDNIELYKRAFIHRSYTKRPELENNEQNIIILLSLIHI